MEGNQQIDGQRKKLQDGNAQLQKGQEEGS